MRSKVNHLFEFNGHKFTVTAALDGGGNIVDANNEVLATILPGKSDWLVFLFNQLNVEGFDRGWRDGKEHLADSVKRLLEEEVDT